MPRPEGGGAAMDVNLSGGEFRFGEGKISGWISVILGSLSVLGVLCFHFPDFLTTPQLRQAYTADQMRYLLGRLRPRHVCVEPPQADGGDRHYPDPAGAVGRRRVGAGRAALCGARLY